MALTEVESGLLRRVFMYGPSALLDEGYDEVTATDFLQRPDVAVALGVMKKEFNHQDILFALTKFGLKRNLARLGPGAVAMLAEALAGPIYARDKEGLILRDIAGRPQLLRPEVSPVQLRAAETILDRLHVEGGSKSAQDRSMGINPDLLLKSVEDAQVVVGDDPQLKTEEERALARERVRIAIERLVPKLAGAQATAAAERGLPTPSKPVKKRSQKGGKKKTVKKKG